MFTHKERKVLEQIQNSQVINLDLRDTLNNLEDRGFVVYGKNGFQVTQDALVELNRETKKVDPMRVNVNSGQLIDKDE